MIFGILVAIGITLLLLYLVGEEGKERRRIEAQGLTVLDGGNFSWALILWLCYLASMLYDLLF